MPVGGSIILNASIVASKGFAGWSVYSATKAACSFVPANLDNGLEGSPPPRERAEPRLYRHGAMAFHKRGGDARGT
jgi:NADP-dependent 3-hydroxy acid dehydrogenase YdfG